MVTWKHLYITVPGSLYFLFASIAAIWRGPLHHKDVFGRRWGGAIQWAALPKGQRGGLAVWGGEGHERELEEHHWTVTGTVSTGLTAATRVASSVVFHQPTLYTCKQFCISIHIISSVVIYLRIYCISFFHISPQPNTPNTCLLYTSDAADE